MWGDDVLVSDDWRYVELYPSNCLYSPYYYYYYYYYVLERKRRGTKRNSKNAFLSAEAPEAPEATESQPTESCTRRKVDKGATFSSGEPRGLFFGLASSSALKSLAINQTLGFHRLAATSTALSRH